jgi:hypothetical protein
MSEQGKPIRWVTVKGKRVPVSPPGGKPCYQCGKRTIGGAWTMGFNLPEGYTICQRCAKKALERVSE